MHFTKPTADRRGDRLAIAQHVGFRILRCGERLSSARVELVEHPRPSVALIADEAQRDRQRVRRAVRGDLQRRRQAAVARC